jgi:putative glutamine amidotransferase
VVAPRVRTYQTHPVTRPAIGLSCYEERARWGSWDTDALLLHQPYAQSLLDVGADPVLIPPGTSEAILDRLDALVLTGGPDVDPALYGATPHPTTDTPREARDATELALYRGARRRGMPVLGICRGLQVMAVAHGGTLHQDLASMDGTCTHREARGTFTDHGATLVAGSLAARLLDAQGVVVNSSHHQAVADPGDLTITGYASDGTIEACEDPSAPFVLGVQWHPEFLSDARLFGALVAEAARWRSAVAPGAVVPGAVAPGAVATAG